MYVCLRMCVGTWGGGGCWACEWVYVRMCGRGVCMHVWVCARACECVWVCGVYVDM
jgi:hypothetical protein